jgi:uncharacterized protein YneR
VIEGYDFLVGVMREDSEVVQEDSKIANEMLFHFHSGEIWYFKDGDVAKYLSTLIDVILLLSALWSMYSEVVQEDSKIANEMLFHFHSGEIWYFKDGDVAK